MKYKYRHTKIIFTVGPSSESEEMLEKLQVAGADICRINMAHASHEWVRTVCGRIRSVSKKTGKNMVIMMDIKGPEIRTGDLKEPVDLVFGDRIDLVIKPDLKPDPNVLAVSVNYPGIVEDVNVGNVIILDNGLLRLEVVAKTSDCLSCQALNPGRLGSRRHINLPGIKVNLPSLTQKDYADIALAIELDVEFFALSFVRQAADIDLLRQYLRDSGSQARILAKMEDQSAVANIDSIIEASDGVMVARGDLGVECPYETLPIIQRSTIRTCIRRGKPVIVATHMLESMISAPVPTRAEVSDVANAVFEQTDCIMLSGETTTGRYPVECVQVMSRITEQIESIAEPSYRTDLKFHRPKDKMLRSAVILAQELKNAGLVVFTRSGYLAQVLSSLRPVGVPICAFTDKPILHKQLDLLWGIEPFLIPFDDDPEITVQQAFRVLKEANWVNPGDWQVVVMNILTLSGKMVDSIQMRQVD
jgi:pyruvate kinase